MSGPSAGGVVGAQAELLEAPVEIRGQGIEAHAAHPLEEQCLGLDPEDVERRVTDLLQLLSAQRDLRSVVILVLQQKSKRYHITIKSSNHQHGYES